MQTTPRVSSDELRSAAEVLHTYEKQIGISPDDWTVKQILTEADQIDARAAKAEKTLDGLLCPSADELRSAAGILHRHAEHFGIPAPSLMMYNADLLRSFAAHCEAEQKANAERDALIEELAQELCAHRAGINPWELSMFRSTARYLVTERGWGKP